MKRWLFPVAATLTMLLVGSAAAQTLCTPVAPKKWEGTITVGAGGFVTSSAYEEAGCDWGAAAPVNGSDGIVWDVDGYSGVTASITSQQSVGAIHRGISGYFLNAECERGGSWGITQAGTPYALGIPEGAKWIVAFQEHGAANTQVTMETAGRECVEEPEPTKPPKKKKKKSRG